MSYLGVDSVDKMFLGSTKIGKAYLGNDLVYTKPAALPYDSKVEYLQSSGSQYIETSIILQSTDEIHLRIRFHNSAGNVYGCFTSSSASDNFCLYCGSASTNGYLRFNGQSVRAFKPKNNTWYEIIHSQNGFYANGTKLASYNNASFTCSSNLMLWNLPNSSSAKVTADISEFYVLRNSNRIIDLFSVRLGQIGYLYNSVTNSLLGNDGSGSFGIGNDIS